MVRGLRKGTIVTGSSGYVAKHLNFQSLNNVIGFDRVSSKKTDIVVDIADITQQEFSCLDEAVVINLAAARSDYGISARDYYFDNVTATSNFLAQLQDSEINIVRFVHVSSVAAIEGENIYFSESLSSDDAYRSTKFLQHELVTNWCSQQKIELVILCPSAIYDNDYGGNTNIGRLIRTAKLLPVLPWVPVRKSLTYMERFCDFIIESTGDLAPGCYLTIEEPVIEVGDLLSMHYPHKPVIRVPFLEGLVVAVAAICEVFGFGSYLNKERARKLFKETSYDAVGFEIDRDSYSDFIRRA